MLLISAIRSVSRKGRVFLFVTHHGLDTRLDFLCTAFIDVHRDEPPYSLSRSQRHLRVRPRYHLKTRYLVSDLVPLARFRCSEAEASEPLTVLYHNCADACIC